MRNIELVIFDNDGVLVDSEIIGIKIETELLRAAGYEISVERLTERFSGMSWGDILVIIEKESGLSLRDALLDKTEAILDARIPKEVFAIDGTRSVLEGLHYPRCVCSNTKMPRLDAMLTKVGLKEFFAPNIFSAKDLGEGRSKPKPDIFLFGAERMGNEPSRTVVIEDTVHGVQGARTAGMQVIGFTGGSHTYPNHSGNLLEAGAMATVSHMRDLPAALAEIAGTDRR
ncbi:HAD family hydrolase [Sinorhizobium fredii]|uniref:HAD family hydrolase n=1 Tax=Rhizobium fredii TaxID=380 RepID=A0A2A6LVT9_RHIFR|nr:HAD family phosphatase [Sinorhizobium fredii]PDT46671.1 HAD family hydrolase [Sinorhizobium fredii]